MVEIFSTNRIVVIRHWQFNNQGST